MTQVTRAASISGTNITGNHFAGIDAHGYFRFKLVIAGGPSPDSVVYVSDQAHSSLARTARAMGLRPHQVRLQGGDASSDSFCYAE